MLPAYLSEKALAETVRCALGEDLGPGDATTRATVGAEVEATARIQAKEAGVVAGCAVAAQVFAEVDEAVRVDWQKTDGDAVEPGDVVARFEGRARSLLTAERTALNFMQRMSGIATAARRMVEAARPHGAEILDTRKTAPGLRPLDKWAVRLGGGTNHRLGLYDLILIKDNHIAAAGGIAEALRAAHAYRKEHAPDLRIEIETRTLDEVEAAMRAEDARPDIILLDNMARLTESGTVDTSVLEEAVRLVGGRCRTEASGNVTLQTVPAIARAGVDAISSGALTHSVRALDLSMEIALSGDDRRATTDDKS